MNWKVTVKEVRALCSVAALCAACGALVVGWLVSAKPEASSSINLGNVTYEKHGAEIKATFSLTNTGPSILLTDSFLEEDFLRVQTDSDWETVERIPGWPGRCHYDYANPMADSKAAFLRIGEEIRMQVILPPKTRRWQLGYKLHELGARESFELRSNSKWTKSIVNAFWRYIPNDTKTNLILGPVMNVQEPLLHPPR